MYLQFICTGGLYMAVSKFSVEKMHTKRNFLWDLENAKKSGEKWTTDYCEILVRYLHSVHGIHVADDFPKRLKEAHQQFHSSKELSLSFKTVDSIIDSSVMWVDYLLSISDYHLLVSEEIISMVRINTSVIGAPYLKQIQGLNLKKQPPFSMRTIVRKNGNGVQIIY